MCGIYVHVPIGKTLTQKLREPFPSVFKQGLFVKMHKAQLGGKCWRFLRQMYTKVQTRILTGHEFRYTEEEREQLYYDIETGLREGSILSPLLYLIFINGLIEELEKQNCGVSLMNIQTGEKIWLGMIMYADDAACVAESPDHLQRYKNS